ncbi:hypothetical protein ACHAXR_001799 [Thalassiosira sp. AJA248-18]
MASIKETSAGDYFEYTGRETVPRNVTKVVFHPSVTEIPNEAFHDCNQLKVVVLNEGLQKIGQDAFYNRRSLESIKFPSTLSVIGYRAFSRCINLREVVLNEGLQRISEWAFYNCKSLESINMPSTLSEVGNCAFCDCYDLREVTLTEGLQTIGKRVFENCSIVESFKFPNISMRFKAIPHAVQREVGYKIIEIPDFSLYVGDISISVASMMNGDNWGGHRESLDRIIGLIDYYELKEATTTFELALWKAYIDKDSIQRPVKKTKVGESKAANNDSREEFRIEVPDPIKDAVLQYFSHNRGW